MKDHPTPPPGPRRRSTRIVFRVVLLINSTDPTAQTEWEQVETRVVSRHGALVSTRQYFPVDAILDIRRRDRERSARVRVVWRSSQQTLLGTDMGLEILDDNNFWEIEFPPDPRSDKS